MQEIKEREVRDQSELQKIIGYRFKNERLLTVALTHSSYCNENRRRGFTVSNERSEFLGDSVLSVITSDLLFHRFPEAERGSLPGQGRRWFAKTRSLLFRNRFRWATICISAKGNRRRAWDVTAKAR